MRKLFLFAAPCATAILLSVLLLPERWLLPLGAICACVGGGAFFLRDRRGLRLRLICFGLAAGVVWTALYQSWTLVPARLLAGTERSIEGIVTDWPRPSVSGTALTVHLRAGAGPALGAVLYAPEEYGDLRPGDRIAGDAVLRLADTQSGEETGYYYAQGIFLTGRARGALQVERAERTPVRFWPRLWAAELKGALRASVPEDAAGFVSGLVTGDKSGLDRGTYTTFQRTGTAHVVAVSGLHVAFLAGLVSRLLGRNRRRTAVLTVLLLAAFAGAAGYTPSVLRASFLQAMLLLAPLAQREEDKPTSLALALLLLLLQNPYAGAGVGLQLSFAASAGIYLCSGTLYERWTWYLPRRTSGAVKLGCRCVRFLAASLATTLGALVFTTPLTAFYFGNLSLISPLANLLVLEAVAAAFAGGLAAGVLGLIAPPLAGAVGALAGLPARYVLWIVRGMSRFPLASVPLESVYLRLWLLMVYVLLFLLAVLRRGERVRIRPILPLCGVTVSLCAALVCTAAELRADRLTLSVLDVGQGQSVALLSQGRTALVDCGGNVRNGAGNAAADFFQSGGCTRLDALILTHCHDDHANGVPELLERMEVGLLVLPDLEEDAPLRQEILDLAEKQGTEVLMLEENTELTLGGTRLRLYRPLGDGGGNEEGLSVLCTVGTFDALITGDMNAAVEGRLVKYGDLPDAEVLIAGHHGSRYASSQLLLETITPEYALLSVGYNSYGHPAPETLLRLDQAGCAIYRTDWMGRITVHVGR